MVLCASLSRMEDFVEIRLWDEERMLSEAFLPFECGLPSYDTLNDVINVLEAELFKSCFTSWVEAKDGDSGRPRY